MKARYFQYTLGLTLVLFYALSGSTAVAADKAAAKDTKGDIATTWVFWPKAGQSKQFEDAVKQHAAWRKSAGEGFVWSIYQPVVGADLTYYVIRSEEHQWKDFDANEAWGTKAKADDVFNRQVEPYVARVEHYFSEDDGKHSHWIDSKDYKYFRVTSYYPKSGTYGERMDALNKIQKAVTDEKWPYPYAIENTIGGKGSMSVVIPLKGYADMADPNPSLMQVLSKSEGSEAAAAATMKQFGSTIDHTDTSIYVYRPDLSTPK